MSDLVIHSVPEGDLEQIESEAEARGLSVEAYMLRLIREKAGAARRRQTLSELPERLREEGAEPISMDDILAAKDSRDLGAA
ncbi:hypothetical protein [Glycomyces xiaoerkulensis]|uniref:hypothetical protein n=1 Tax=Glycomyces xiaoerkulensis TaxID=2038139 RepID=UPI000C258A1B|nr:hypothetical protein [Glycomyces xiaoerkulensis]